LRLPRIIFSGTFEGLGVGTVYTKNGVLRGRVYFGTASWDKVRVGNLRVQNLSDGGCLLLRAKFSFFRLCQLCLLVDGVLHSVCIVVEAKLFQPPCDEVGTYLNSCVVSSLLLT
jgi:hypothetical protein